MGSLIGFELYALDLPFRKPFKHAAHERWTSDSLLLKCTTDSGAIGFGECLPRDYVSGESRDQVFSLLKDELLPRLQGMEFHSMEELYSFLRECNGRAPQGWLPEDQPQTAAWAAIDLALLDAFGHTFGEPVRLKSVSLPADFRYSVVLSSHSDLKFIKTLALARLYGFRQIKLKVDADNHVEMARLARRIMGRNCDIRVDVNMAWDETMALELMPRMAEYGVRSFEQPLDPQNLTGLARLVRDTGLEVMVDESLNDARSLEDLIREKACTSVNVRISKCGGLIGAEQRCWRAMDAGLKIQIGCQVGETSLLSAAQLVLIAGIGTVAYGEGCFGRHLLREDPVQPLLQFGYGGVRQADLSHPGSASPLMNIVYLLRLHGKSPLVRLEPMD